MTIAYGRLAFKVGFDTRGNWVTASGGTKVFIPVGVLYEPSDRDIMVGVSLLFVLAAVLVTRDKSRCVDRLVVLRDRKI